MAQTKLRVGPIPRPPYTEPICLRDVPITWADGMLDTCPPDTVRTYYEPPSVRGRQADGKICRLIASAGPMRVPESIDPLPG